MRNQQITISGDLGAGKSSVAKELADQRAMHLFSTGDIHRQIAASLGRSTLETNVLAEEDESIDDQIDSQTRELSHSDVPTVFDSRLAWHFVDGAFKVHLLVDPAVGSNRIADRTSDVESYKSVTDATRLAQQRVFSERRRFLARYNVDIATLRNYDLIIDTSYLTLSDVVGRINSAVDDGLLGHPSPTLLISTRRILPTLDLEMDIGRAMKEDQVGHVADEPVPLALAYSPPFFYCIETFDHMTVSAALRSGESTIEASLLYEDTEMLPIGLTANAYFEACCRPQTVYTWEDIHEFRFDSYPPHFPVDTDGVG